MSAERTDPAAQLALRGAPVSPDSWQLRPQSEPVHFCLGRPIARTVRTRYSSARQHRILAEDSFLEASH